MLKMRYEIYMRYGVMFLSHPHARSVLNKTTNIYQSGNSRGAFWPCSTKQPVILTVISKMRPCALKSQHRWNERHCSFHNPSLSHLATRHENLNEEDSAARNWSFRTDNYPEEINLTHSQVIWSTYTIKQEVCGQRNPTLDGLLCRCCSVPS